MPDPSKVVEELLFDFGEQRRWVQDSPILPNVWKAFIGNPGRPVDLLMTPHRGCRPGDLAVTVRNALADARRSKEDAAEIDVAHNKSSVVAHVYFDELIQFLVPLSHWYQVRIQKYFEKSAAAPAELPSLVQWWLRLIGYVSLQMETTGQSGPQESEMRQRGVELLSQSSPPGQALLFRIALNRTAKAASLESIQTIKADAARRVFDVDTSRICWAVLDSGIDARHEAFRDGSEEGRSRVRESYDFTRVRRLIALASTPGDQAEAALETEFGLSRNQVLRMRTSLLKGGDIDWEALKPALRVNHDGADAERYFRELHPHGTHVAGILGGRKKDKALDESDFIGVCPDIRLIDLRILDKTGRSKDGRTTEQEFDTMAALQFVTHLNSFSDEPVVHGVNLSIQLQHDPTDSACGRTPVCEECNRLVASGVVVVAAAGNLGIDRADASANTTEGAFRGISIADPGNADAVITVGSTHRKRPHTYGVSFFSSRGPTGDGRQKPDLVAPGEKILGPVPDQGYEEMQGTSQAAPHVSGAAAMLLARHSELIGSPERVKRILCATATDLGRLKEFQGAGLVDILRALQST